MAKELLHDALERAKELPTIHLSDRSICDFELLATGAFSPLDRFMGAADYRRVVEEMRLAGGALFPIPVTLPVANDEHLELDREVALVNARNEILAVMRVEEIYDWDLETAARHVFGTTDERHPLVAEMHSWGSRNISGPLQVLRLPQHYDFTELRLTPAQTRAQLARIASGKSASKMRFGS